MSRAHGLSCIKRSSQSGFVHGLSPFAATMGTTIGQYRSRIGCHNNFVKAKDESSCVRGRFWNMMLMMVYLHVFYLPALKQVVGHYKLWNEVMFWFTQMMCYNVYIPLLIR